MSSPDCRRLLDYQEPAAEDMITSIAIGVRGNIGKIDGGVCIDDTPLHFENMPRRSGHF